MFFFIFGRFSIAGKLPKWPKIPFQYPLALRHPKILEKCRKHHRILVSVRNRFWPPPAKADIATAILTNVIEHLVLLLPPNKHAFTAKAVWADLIIFICTSWLGCRRPRNETVCVSSFFGIFVRLDSTKCILFQFYFCVLFRRLRGLGWGGNNVNWICTHTYTCRATLLDVLLHFHTRAHTHTCAMLRYWMFSCTCTHTHTSCYTTGHFLFAFFALAHRRHATLLDILLHLHTDVMLRYWTFSCTCTQTSCYATGCSLALPHAHTRHAMLLGIFFAFFALAHRRHATLLDILLHLHTDVMLRYWTFSCTCTQTSCYATGCSLALPHTHTSCYATGHSLDVMMGLCNAFSLSDISETWSI